MVNFEKCSKGDWPKHEAYLIDGEWYHPLWGCDTMQTIIDEIRATNCKVIEDDPE
jgi:hypothetical protein